MPKLPDDLLRAATVGLRRHTQPLAPATPPLDEMLVQVSQRDDNRRGQAESHLLLMAAGMTLRQRVGYQPGEVTQPVPPACPDTLDFYVSRQAIRHMLMIVNGNYVDALWEWLSNVWQSGQHIPPEYLPMMLDFGYQRPYLRQAIANVVGVPGRWLAMQSDHDRWLWLYTPDRERVWQEGSSAARADMIYWLRDHNPAEARERIVATWEESNAQLQAQFLHVLANKLSMADEPFLNRLVQEGTHSHGARQLLMRLPESRFFRHMVDRLMPLLTMLRVKGKPPRIIITPDGLIEENDDFSLFNTHNLHQALKSDETWVWQLFNSIPPKYWMMHWQASGQDLIEGALNSPYKDYLLEAWTQSAVVARDYLFILELLRFDEVQRLPKNVVMSLENLPELQTEDVARYWLQKGDIMTFDKRVLTLLNQLKNTWRPHLTELFVAHLSVHAPAIVRARWKRSTITRFAYHYALESRDYIMQVFDTMLSQPTGNRWISVAEETRDILAFRQRMHDAIYRRSRAS